jgi:hypothetical protein
MTRMGYRSIVLFYMSFSKTRHHQFSQITRAEPVHLAATETKFPLTAAFVGVESNSLTMIHPVCGAGLSS